MNSGKKQKHERFQMRLSTLFWKKLILIYVKFAQG